ncbi:MAG: two pore domain potassium channel family protein [Rubrobacter sp.]|nr:two pore domain potassium channel family protein [Rubrobacter sp.]
MSNGQPPQERDVQLGERTKIEGRFGMVLFLLIIAVFFSISAPDEPWALLVTTIILALTLSVAMWASGVRPMVARAGLGFAVLGIGVSIVIAVSVTARIASGGIAITSLLLTLVTMGAVARRILLQVEISVITVLGALCIYVLLGLSFAFVFNTVGDLGPQPFFASHERGTRSDYMYFSFITMETVGYGDLTPQGGLGRALAATEGLLGQIYLVTAVAALVGNIGRTR